MQSGLLLALGIVLQLGTLCWAGIPYEACSNTCPKAKNGICDEGRPVQGKTSHLLLWMATCDLGTDCDDCGPYITAAASVPWEDPRNVGPIGFLRSRDVQVRVMQAAVPPALKFSFAYTDPAADSDVSRHMDDTGLVERGISAVAYTLLKGRCLRPDGGRSLVVDVGANFGWFSLIAARLGCRVIAFEPVPLFRSFFTFSVHLNGLEGLIDIRPRVVSHEGSKTMKMVVPGAGIWGTAGIDGLNVDTRAGAAREEIEVPSVRLEDEIKEDVLMMKVDVEGWEWSVIAGAAGLLGNYTVENILMEYSPGVAERHYKWDAMAATPGMLRDLISKYGYSIGHIGDTDKHHAGDWEDPLPPLREVTLNNLKYDIDDVRQWQNGTMACPPPPELAKFAAWRHVCKGSPEGLSPRSFRSEFGFNTNIWCAKGASLGAPYLQLQGPVGVLNPNDPPAKFFQTNPLDYGMGGRPCYHLAPDVQVRHRCKCSKPEVCGEEESLALQAVAAGHMAQNYVLP
ncbi:hypothetical protein HYH03_008275 [Edaphochlamys debaryana]|uniref:Methyltransferase FkbM domain-containing protein n=1 Tax=Edaphochlamys debaryana TaxID=47281 RepID=A0A835Y040_9CHLO|nr:hypothetical protein HYH03_008275 [Edaphochlamys debaryana]|eukprot:KAG2493458.1 hypothetical protein HYH03_008275 [Edaphochlamys debaryana]